MEKKLDEQSNLYMVHILYILKGYLIEYLIINTSERLYNSWSIKSSHCKTIHTYIMLNLKLVGWIMKHKVKKKRKERSLLKIFFPID